MKKLYSKDSKNRIRVWEIKTEGDSFAVRDGLLNGKMKDWTYTKCEAKNIGRANETTPEEQAKLESVSEITKKKKKKYFDSIEDALENNVFTPMLADSFKNNSKVDNTWVSQPKLDGLRCTVMKTDSLKMLSRERRDILSCKHIANELEKIDFDFYIDGELYNHSLKDNFNKLVSLVKKQKDITEEEYKEISETVQYHVYDAYFPNEPDLPFTERYERLSVLKDVKFIHIVPILNISSVKDIESNLENYLSLGYEGQMLRKKSSKYKVAGRSKDLLKHKVFIDEEFEIVDIESGLGQWDGAAKKVKVLVDGEIVGCGIDGDKEYLTEVLNNKSVYIGKLATVKYFGRTPDNSLRFPVVKDLNRLF